MTTPVSLRRRLMPYATTRSVLISACVVLAVVVVCVLTLTWGPLGVKLSALFNVAGGKLDAETQFVLERLTGPRLLVAIAVGAALGISGALFQRVTRNPLGSPDVIGLAAGAGAGVAIVTAVAPTTPPALGALVGATAAVGLIYFTNGSGFASPTAMIISGIGVATLCTAITQYVVATSLRDVGQQLSEYTVGSLNSRTIGDAAIMATTVVVLIPFLAHLSGRLLIMDLGDALSDSLGGQAVRTRTLAIVISVILSAVAVAVAGPISFVALSAPHIARRLTASTATNLTAAALVGVFIMVSADAIAQHMPLAEGLPTGIVTIGVGGLYLGYLLLVYSKDTST